MIVYVHWLNCFVSVLACFSVHCSSPEFESLVEAVLENTLLNVLKEASAGELRLTAPIYTIAKPLPAQPTS